MLSIFFVSALTCEGHHHSHDEHDHKETCFTFDVFTGKCLDDASDVKTEKKRIIKKMLTHPSGMRDVDETASIEANLQADQVIGEALPNSQLPIIPYPNDVKINDGYFTFNENTKIFTNLEKDEKKHFLDYLAAEQLTFVYSSTKQEENSLNLLIDSSLELNDEGYTMVVTEKSVTISAPKCAGIFYGIQSLLQLINLGNRNGMIPCIEIKDQPELKYRGFMLDVSRHFYPPSFIKKQLDMLAHFKINRFHFHLVDTGGWRLESKKYPQLTQKTAYRPEIRWVLWLKSGAHYCDKDAPGAYGGFYTQEEMKELIRYAAERYITIIPEVEMPGHNEEVLATFPEFSCSGKPYVDHDLCIGNPGSLQLMKDLLEEVMELFPSELIHIGGDEATMTSWKTCPKCQQLKKDKGFTSEEQLQSYFIKEIDSFITSKGRKLIGWDEILKGGLSEHACVMSWTGEQGGITAANAGHEVVMTPTTYCYLDYMTDQAWTQPPGIGGLVKVNTIYNHQPVPPAIDEKHRKFVIGFQGNLWTEYVYSNNHCEHMIWPRIIAIAENGWIKQDLKNYDMFAQRVSKALDWLTEKGYRPYRFDQSIAQ